MSLTKQIEQLCHKVIEEKDADKLLSLVDQLNRELERNTSEAPETKASQQGSETVAGEQKPPHAA